MVVEIERNYKFQFSFEPKIKGEQTSTSTSSFFPYEWGYGANGFPTEELQDIIQEYDYQVLGNHIKQTIGQPHQSLLNLILLIIFTYLIPSIVILTKIYNTYAIVFIIITFILSIISIPFIVLFKNLRMFTKLRVNSSNEIEHIQKLNEIVEGYLNPIPFYLSFPENYEYSNFGNCVYKFFQRNKPTNVETMVFNEPEQQPIQPQRKNSRKLSLVRKSKNLLQMENDELKRRLNLLEGRYDQLKKYYFEIKLKETIIKLEEFMLRDFNEHHGTSFQTMQHIISNESNSEALYQKFSKKQIQMLKLLKRKVCNSLQLPATVSFDMSLNMSVKPFSTMNSADLETVKQLFGLLEKYYQNNHAFIY
ncbi:hypothetical protein RB653_004376 [Dictyostelium firmibasis]|uniref:Transmembrane protein n=1 Tax=Dictyostelium firmibasis TaxID=79012 RepID=A0AAN7U7P2_9MYCE